MRLVLVRHAESKHNISGIIADQAACTGVTERGRRQARALATRLCSTDEFDDCVALLSSPILRALQTAQILAAVLPVNGVEQEPGLCELRPGEADGLTGEAYHSRYGSFDPVAFPTRPFAPGGESWQDFTTRVRRTLENLADRFAGRTVVAVTHAGFVVVSVLTLFDIPRPGTGAWLDPVHTGLTEWSVSGSTWRLVRYNDAGHLLEAQS